MTMVNTIEYRVECQILSTLHRENRLAKRFPIGKESLIRTWQPDDVKTWHRTHYRPDNVLLYIVGDVEPSEVEKCIEDKFGHITAEKQAAEIKLLDLKPEASKLADALVGGKDVVKSRQSWHYPPVKHDWSSGSDEKYVQNFKASEDDEDSNKYDLHLQDSYELDEKVEFLATTEIDKKKNIRPHIFRHELLQAFSLHLFAKRPVESITDIDSFRRSLARRVALAALQIRLNVGGRSDDPAFTFVEFNQLDSAREGCAVCSLDMTAEPYRWKDAICKSVSEIRKLGVYGVTPGEMERYASALMTDAEQLAAQGDRISNGDQLSFLMETVANGHTFMSPEQSYYTTAKALSTLTLEEVNQAARDMCSHITCVNADEPAQDGVLIVTACSPKDAQPGDDSFCDEESLVQTLYDACQLEIEPEEDVVVPHTLVPEEELKKAMEAHPPAWESGKFTDGTPDTPADKLTRPFTLRRLNNGIRVGVGRNPAESQRGHLRIIAPGGRDAERRLGFKSGSMAVGSRTMQEGGAFGPWTREQVELFCVDHLLMVEINCNEESLTIDFVFPTSNVGNVGFGDDVQLGITGTEAVLQIVREIIVGFHWEEDALGRSKQSYRSAHEGLQKNLEGKSTEMIMEAMTGHDERFLSVDVDTVNSVTLEDAKSAIMSQLQPEDLEITVAGDFDAQEVLDMILQYIGTIPADANAKFRLEGQEVGKAKEFGSVPDLQLPGKFLELELPDSDPRAVSYVAGSAPNMWGRLADGTTVAERVMEADKRQSDYDKRRRSHPLFANVALSLISEIVNRRLFSTVRERRQLTYDANFSLTGFERLAGGWFLVTVTASKEKAQAALEACKETLDALRTTNKVTADNLESAKRVVLNRHEMELRASSYWATLMAGIQEESVPLKGPLSVTDYHAVVEAITTKDLQLALECLGLDDAELYTAIGRTVQPEGLELEDDIITAAPATGMRRGGALMN
jgi:predicted Zn-dependent peptidase